MNNKQSHNINKVTLATLIVTLGVIYGDIGTSPLYVMSAMSLRLAQIAKFLMAVLFIPGTPFQV